MSEINNYYQSIIDKVNKLIEEKQYDEAIFLLEDELNTPYIPIDFQTIMEDLLITANADKNYFSGLNLVEKLNRKQLIEAIVSNNKLNTSALYLFFERYQNKIDEEELLIFENHFVNRKIDNEEKTSLFEAMAFQKINNNFRYYNNNLKEEFDINPIETKIFEQIPLYIETKDIINSLASKEPSLLNFCFNILLAIYKYYFPLIPNYDPKDLAHSICNYMLSTLQGKSVDKNEVTDLIKKIIAY